MPDDVLIFHAALPPDATLKRLQAQVIAPWSFGIRLVPNWYGNVSANGFKLTLNSRGGRGLMPQVSGLVTAWNGGTLVQVELQMWWAGERWTTAFLFLLLFLLLWSLFSVLPWPALPRFGLTALTTGWAAAFLYRALRRQRECLEVQVLQLLLNDLGGGPQVPCLSADERALLRREREDALWAWA